MSWPSHLHNDVLWLDKLSPAAFEKHSGRETARKWKNNVWVIVNGEKVPLCKTVLLKYYNQVSKTANGSHRSHNGRASHRDEFVRCTRCNKERRFRLRTKEECRIHHDALADANWKCSDLPYDKYVYSLILNYWNDIWCDKPEMNILAITFSLVSHDFSVLIMSMAWNNAYYSTFNYIFLSSHDYLFTPYSIFYKRINKVFWTRHLSEMVYI